MNRNYQKELDALIQQNKTQGITPKLMLHACCACCASYVLEYLSEHFEIYLLYYNPNITEKSEYDYRYSELERLVSQMPLKGKVNIVECEYDPQRYLEKVKGLENEPERGSRCSVCFDMRLSYTAKYALEYGCDYFATTLTISPLKNSSIINSIGEEVSKKSGAKYLPTDFKKKNGYKRSIELSNEYNLYRQNYCGCVFSK
ncbi:MAG: epoxyqueuosine reductase QueH [Ruminococcaceae bacterium]|nr:epoxyqueuosine reductase QueH [Oscillospiraceae bacterium]